MKNGIVKINHKFKYLPAKPAREDREMKKGGVWIMKNYALRFILRILMFIEKILSHYIKKMIDNILT